MVQCSMKILLGACQDIPEVAPHFSVTASSLRLTRSSLPTGVARPFQVRDCHAGAGTIQIVMNKPDVLRICFVL